MINQEIIAIKEKLQSAISPQKIYLFGSYAKNTFHDNSDYDFYVVVDDSRESKLDISQKAYKSLRGIRNKPVDIVVGYESAFNDRAQSNTLEKTVVQEGVLLYER